MKSQDTSKVFRGHLDTLCLYLQNIIFCFTAVEDKMEETGLEMLPSIVMYLSSVVVLSFVIMQLLILSSEIKI